MDITILSSGRINNYPGADGGNHRKAAKHTAAAGKPAMPTVAAISNWAREALAAMVRNIIIKGYIKNTIRTEAIQSEEGGNRHRKCLKTK